MKKLITMCLFAFGLIIGVQSVEAQEKYKTIDEMARIQSQDLQKILGLNDDQTAMISRTIYAKQKSYLDITTSTKLDEKEADQLLAKIDMNFKSKMLQILNEEQFQAYGDYLSKLKTNPKDE
ncbi:MAG: hypothetical protein KJP20_02780 [Bacteroidia bacterium]|nr:hypothetical protein [Bacteroidia bacterium]NNK60382.1 hypothetical protein [Flavobacteriaceae bacterium]